MARLNLSFHRTCRSKPRQAGEFNLKRLLLDAYLLLVGQY